MKRNLFALLLLSMLYSSLLFATDYDLKGEWVINYTLTVDPNHPGQSSNNSFNILVLASHPNSGEFAGARIDDSNGFNAVINGQIIKASDPYTQDIIKFDLVNWVDRPYRSTFIGFIKNSNTITNGYFVDSYGNVASFTGNKQ